MHTLNSLLNYIKMNHLNETQERYSYSSDTCYYVLYFKKVFISKEILP